MTAKSGVTFTLTMVTVSVTLSLANLAHEGRLGEVDLKAGASAVPAGGVTTRTRAESGSAFLAIPRHARPLILLMLICLLRDSHCSAVPVLPIECYLYEHKVANEGASHSPPSTDQIVD